MSGSKFEKIIVENKNIKMRNWKWDESKKLNFTSNYYKSCFLANIDLFEVNNRNGRKACSGVFLLILNIFHAFFYCFY